MRAIPKNFARAALGMDVTYYSRDDKSRFRDHHAPYKILLSDRLKTDYFENKTEQLIFMLLLNKDITIGDQALQELRSPWNTSDNDEDSFNLFIELMMMIQEEVSNGLTMTAGVCTIVHSRGIGLCYHDDKTCFNESSHISRKM